MRKFIAGIAISLGLMLVGSSSVVKEAAAVNVGGSSQTSAWVQAHHTRSRLIAGRYVNDADRLKVRAGIHIELDPEWKTYWRTPGGAGGVSPYFDWQASKNVKSVEVLYPAPARIRGEDGYSIGYKGAVVFPVIIEAIDAREPVELALRLDYGVCKDICVPVQTKHYLSVSSLQGRGSYGRVDAQLIERYALKVPLENAKPGGEQPFVKDVRINLKDAPNSLIVDAEFPAGVAGADLFVEAPEGLYVALPERKALGETGGMRFLIDLTKGEDPKLFKGKELTLTLVSDRGQSEVRWRVPLK